MEANDRITILFNQGTKSGERVSKELFHKQLIKHSEQKPNLLNDLDYEKILKAFSKVYSLMAKQKHPLYHVLRPFGLSFFLNFIHSRNLRTQLENALGPDAAMNNSKGLSDGRKIYYLPRGTVGHWIAGNVPVLGLISVTLAILTRNCSVVKLPGQGIDFISDFLMTFLDHDMGEYLAVGEKIANACLVVSFNGSNREYNEAMASVCDTRIVWGSPEAVETVRSLCISKARSETIAFEHKVSASVVDPKLLDDKDYKNIAVDSILFNQMACTSPHWLFVKGDSNMCRLFGKRLAEILKTLEDKPFFTAPNAYSASKVLEFRTRCLLNKEDLISSAGTQWTIYFSEPDKPFVGYGNKIIGVKEFETINDITQYIPPNIQTITHKLTPDDTEALRNLAVSRYADRLPALGRSHDFELPWDGQNVIDKLTRKLVVWPSSE